MSNFQACLGKIKAEYMSEAKSRKVGTQPTLQEKLAKSHAHAQELKDASALDASSRSVKDASSRSVKSVSRAIVSGPTSENLELHFEDNFENDTLDPCVWERFELSATTTDFLSIGCATSSTDNSYIENGNLVLEALEQEILGPNTYTRFFPIDVEFDTSNFPETPATITKNFIGHATTAQIWSKNPIVHYGYFEVTAEIPFADSMYASIELVRKTVAKDEKTIIPYGRVIITQQQGISDENTTNLGIIYGGPAGATASNRSGSFSLQPVANRTESHRYGVELLPGVVRWWLDAEVVGGKVVGGTCLEEFTEDEYFTLNTTNKNSEVPNTPFDRPLFIKIALSPGGGDTLFLDDNDYNFDFAPSEYPDINFGELYPYQTFPYDVLGTDAAKLKISSVKYYKIPCAIAPDVDLIDARTKVCKSLCVPTCTSNDLVLDFEDHFCGSRLNKKNWISQELTGEGAGNEEKQIYVNVDGVDGDKYTFIEDNKLHLRAEMVDPTIVFPPGNFADPEGPDYNTNNPKGFVGYMSKAGKVVSQRTFFHGYTEVRAKVPLDNYTFPAIWMFPWHTGATKEQFNQIDGLVPNTPFFNWPRCGEIDIVEAVGTAYKQPFLEGLLFSNNIIVGGPDFWGVPFFTAGQDVCKDIVDTTVEEYINEFHTYGLEWTPEYLRFWYDAQVVDGKIVGGQLLRTQPLNDSNMNYYNHLGEQVPATDVYSQPLPLSMNIAVWPNGADEIQDPLDGCPELPSEMVIDYVRHYKFGDYEPIKKCKCSKKHH
jgi:hypothetical protein